MRQLWISVGILVVMVALLFWNVVKVDQLTQPMLKELSQATTAARGDDWPAAEVLTQQIQVHCCSGRPRAICRIGKPENISRFWANSPVS